MREAANTTAVVITTLDSGTPLEIIGQTADGEWLNVTANGQTGCGGVMDSSTAAAGNDVVHMSWGEGGVANGVDDRSWVAVEIIERRANGDVVCRELNKVLPGIWIARSWQVATGDDA